jgi:23S rRNA pseudouridine1911/1915/1917 synthase
MKDIANTPTFTVLDETEDYIVVSKPAPLKIHPGSPNGASTLFDLLRELLAYEIVNGGQVSIINRLDRETSGVVLVAKTAAMAREFGMAMMERRFQKRYLALVHGWPQWEQIECDGPILRKAGVAKSSIWVKQIVHPDGAECHTGFITQQRLTFQNRQMALVQATPHTGRMHQIRVHLSHLGHPVVGDKLYGEDETCYLDFMETGWTPELEKRLLIRRHALHSEMLSLQSETLCREWRSPLPPDIAFFLPNGGKPVLPH